MANNKTILVDFDGVIHKYSKGWGKGDIYDIPVNGTKAALQKFIDDGYEVVIYSTRNHDRNINGKFEGNQVKEMQAWLKKHDIPYSRIATEPGKPIAKYYIDDNAIRFTGWNSTLNKMKKLNKKAFIEGFNSVVN